MKAWHWMIVAVVAPALPMLLDVPYALVSLTDTMEPAGTWTRTVVGVSVPDPLSQVFSRVTSSGLPIVAPAVAFLMPARYRGGALIAAGAVLGVLIAVALGVTQVAQTGDAVRAGILAACYAGSIAAAVRAHRLTETA